MELLSNALVLIGVKTWCSAGQKGGKNRAHLFGLICDYCLEMVASTSTIKLRHVWNGRGQCERWEDRQDGPTVPFGSSSLEILVLSAIYNIHRNLLLHARSRSRSFEYGRSSAAVNVVFILHHQTPVWFLVSSQYHHLTHLMPSLRALDGDTRWGKMRIRYFYYYLFTTKWVWLSYRHLDMGVSCYE